MPVSELEARMSGEEFAEWQAWLGLKAQFDTMTITEKVDAQVAADLVYRPPKDEDED